MNPTEEGAPSHPLRMFRTSRCTGKCRHFRAGPVQLRPGKTNPFDWSSRMKRLAALCVILSLGLFLGCGDDKTKTDKSKTEKSKTVVPPDKSKTEPPEKTKTDVPPEKTKTDAVVPPEKTKTDAPPEKTKTKTDVGGPKITPGKT